MLFNGTYAEFHGGNQAEQANARLACDSLQVYFDRRISLKEGTKTEHPAKVHHMMCDKAVRVEDSTYDGKELVKYQQMVAPSIRFTSLYPDVEVPGQAEPVSDGNQIRGTGPGEVRIMGKGGPDPLAAPTAPAPGAAPAKPKPAGAALATDDALKMTYVSYQSSMFADSKKNYTKFISNVRVLNFPCTDPHADVNLDVMLTKLPEGAMYLRSDVLEVWTIPGKTADGKDRKYSEMYATGGVSAIQRVLGPGRDDPFRRGERSDYLRGRHRQGAAF